MGRIPPGDVHRRATPQRQESLRRPKETSLQRRLRSHTRIQQRIQGEFQAKMNLLDTGAVIDKMDKDSYFPAFISTITLIEVLRGVDDKKRPSAKQLLEESFSVLNLDNIIIETYCYIYRVLKEKGNLLPDADLLIAATAIAHDLTLETKDAHFQRLKMLGLKLK